MVALLAGVVRGAAPGEHSFRSVAISPDGRRVASLEIERRFDSPAPLHGPIVIRDATDGRVLQRVDPCADCRYAGLSWAPDSTRLVFVARDEARHETQLFATAGTEVRALASIEGEANSPRFSADGRELAVLVTLAAHKHTGALEAGAPIAGDVGAPPDEQRLALLPAGGGQLRLLSPADRFVYEYDPVPGGGFVTISAAGDGDANWWIAELDRITSDGAQRTIARFDLQMAVPKVAPDGRSVQFIGGLMSDAGVVGGEIYSVAIEGGTPHSLTPGFAGSFTSISWRGRQLRATAILVDRAALTEVSATGRVRTLWSGPVMARAGEADTGAEVSLSADGTKMATAVEDFAQGPELLVGAPERPRKITTVNAGGAALDVRSLRWKSDALEIQGWLVCPIGAGRRPLIVHVHGGPSAAVLPLFGTDYSLYTSVHEWAARGYCMLLPNPRGSYGQGEAFTRANVRDFGGGDFRDILAGVEAAVATGRVDPQRVGIHGHSYGGFMTMWAVTHSTRFKAAIAGAGLSDWISYYGTNGIDTWMLPFFGASMYEEPAVYRAASPLESIRAARTPTLLYTGDADVEVPASQSLEFWHALRTLGVPVELHVYPGEGHQLRQPEHVLDLRRRLPEWFDRYLSR
jgi:dipeptidyl aminopeptidase/acylaminoacyl peptidase